MDHGDDEAHGRPHFDLAAMRRGVVTGMMSPAQAVWYLRYNADEDSRASIRGPRQVAEPL
jgi:hypothetical protein